MNKTSEPLLFPVPLSLEARNVAQQYHQQQLSPQKAKQVYLNTLAVYAGDYYLRCLGLETDKDNSDSLNPIALKFMDVADLAVKQLGKLECRPVLPNAEVCLIPPEARSDRIGYLVVEISQSLKQATILGFTPTATTEIFLDRLRSLAEFPEYLNKIRQSKSPTHSLTISTANLSKWLEGIFEENWLTERAIFEMNKSLVGVRNLNQTHEVRRAKLLDLGIELDQRKIAMAIAITKDKDDLVNVLVRVHPTEENHLPPNLKLALLAKTGETLQQVSSRIHDNYIQLRRFRGQKGDCFSIEISLDRFEVTEKFQF
jgi:hypothetical protein